MNVILQTKRLLLREMSQRDIDFVAELIGDTETMRFYPKRYSRMDAVGWIARQIDRYAKDGHGLWLAVDRETREPRGQVGLVMQDIDGEREPELGWIIDRRFWRQGLASEAACAVRDWAFERYDHVISLIRPTNEPSQAVARKIGMSVWKSAPFHGDEHLVFRVDRASVRPT